MTEMMTTLSLQIVGVVEPIIQHADWFFPGGGLGGLSAKKKKKLAYTKNTHILIML